MGLATGYYYNFLRRLLLDDGLITRYPEKIRQVIVVRPSSLASTFNQDMAVLEKSLSDANIEWEEVFIGERTKDLGDKMRGLAINHSDGVVFDLPSTLFPLQHSPRLQAQRDRIDSLDHKPLARSLNQQRNLQASEAVLRQVEKALRHHLRRDGNQVRSQLLHFASIEETPALIEELRGKQ